MLSIERLRLFLSYDPETGGFTWKARPRSAFSTDRIWKSWNSKWAGKPAFTSSCPRGYKRGQIENEKFLAHRVAWAFFHGHWPQHQIDHIDGDPTNNRIVNLRDVEPFANQANQRRRSDNVSGVTGVSWSKRTNKWQARININKREVWLGLHDTFEQAVAARTAAEIGTAYTKRHGT